MHIIRPPYKLHPPSLSPREGRRMHLSLTRLASHTCFATRRHLHIKSARSPTRNALYACCQPIRTVNLSICIRISIHIHRQSRMSWLQFLRSISSDREDVDRESIGSLSKLLVECFFLVFALDGDLRFGLNKRMGIPVCETGHDALELLVRVEGAVSFFFVFERGIGVNCRFCLGVSLVLMRSEQVNAYFVA